MSEEKKLKGTKLAHDLLEKGEIPLDKKGKPSIKDIMEKAGLARSTAFHVRREFMKVQKAREGALPSKVEVDEVITEGKPPLKPPPREPEEPEVIGEKPLTYEEIMEELADFQEFIADGYKFVFAKDGIIPTVLGAKYARPEAKCDRMARMWIRYLKRRIDPETLEGYDIVMLAINHGFFLAPIGFTYWNEQRKKTEKEE